MRISTSGLKQQFIPVNGIINARDLGGYIMKDGRRLRDGVLIRTAHMAALGASRETIVADFDATNRIYEKEVRRCCRNVRLMGGKEAELETVKAFLGANTDNFIKTLDRIDREYGSMEAYLKGPIGLTDKDILTLRERYLE